MEVPAHTDSHSRLGSGVFTQTMPQKLYPKMHDAQVSGTPPTCTKRPCFDESSEESSSKETKVGVDPKSDSDSESSCVAVAVSPMLAGIHRTITDRQQAARPTTPPAVAKMANTASSPSATARDNDVVSDQKLCRRGRFGVCSF